MSKKNLLLLPGDGIGPEIMNEVKKLISFLNTKKKLDLVINEELVGGASYDKNKTPLTDDVLYKAQDSDAVLLGAVGGPQYDKLDFAKRPERALLRLRKELRLFANLRPAICFSELVSASSLKPEIVSDLDIMIVRELTGGIYFGEPRGIETRDNERVGFNTLVYAEHEIERIARVGFDLASKRNGRLCSVDKANVLEVS